KQYGNTESLRQNYKAFNIANMKDWCDQLWDVFHNGKYTDPIAGKEMDLSKYRNVNVNTQCTFDIYLYNSDGSVNLDKIKQLENEETKIINNTRSYKFFSYNGLSYLQCTWWANARASTYLSKFGTKYKEYPTITGNGGDYWQNNINGGWFKYGKEPKANSLLGYKAGSNMGEYGHITYVEAVDPINKKIYISHCSSGERWNGIGYNWGGQHYYALDWDGKLWGELPQGYIYLDEPL
ncbi:MAG: CHAP domain-containing protein, partial [Clostridia bacterium]|nr:CHAP domain-containing protein [Bacilli bacterium]MBR0350793.1 CHAP domain-containing protein [Clostridia bacterium]